MDVLRLPNAPRPAHRSEGPAAHDPLFPTERPGAADTALIAAAEPDETVAPACAAWRLDRGAIR